jgi:hypothetical protein
MLAHRGDRKAKPTLAPYRTVTVDEVRTWAMLQDRALAGAVWPPPLPTLYYLDSHGKAANIRQNGKIKTWKRDATRVELPVKFGMYEAFRITDEDIAAGRLLVREPAEA